MMEAIVHKNVFSVRISLIASRVSEKLCTVRNKRHENEVFRRIAWQFYRKHKVFSATGKV